MTTEDNATPAGEVNYATNEDAAASLIMGPEEEPDTSTPEAEGAASREEVTAETEEVEAQAETEEADDEAEAAESREDEVEDEAEDYYDFDKIHPDTQLRLRDGRVVRFGDIKRDWAELQDVSRHKQELEQRASQFQQAQAQIQQQQQYLQHVLPRAIQALKTSIPDLPQAPDHNLARTDPLTYTEQLAHYNHVKAEREAKIQQLQSFEQEQARQQSEVQHRTVEQQRAFMEQEHRKLLDAMPDLRDEAKRRSFAADYMKVGQEVYGFSEQELSQARDHRLLLMARDAIAYRKLKAQKPKVAEKAKQAAPVKAPGKRVSEAQRKASDYSEGMARLRKTGSMEDAAELLLNHHLS